MPNMVCSSAAYNWRKQVIGLFSFLTDDVYCVGVGVFCGCGVCFVGVGVLFSSLIPFLVLFFFSLPLSFSVHVVQRHCHIM